VNCGRCGAPLPDPSGNPDGVGANPDGVGGTFSLPARICLKKIGPGDYR